MLDEAKTKKEQSVDLALLSGLTRRQLRELEEKEKTPAQKTAEAVIMVLPLLCDAPICPSPFQFCQNRAAASFARSAAAASSPAPPSASLNES